MSRMNEVERGCAFCGAVMRRRAKEGPRSFARRKNCSPACVRGSRLAWLRREDPEQAFLDRAMPEPNTGCWIWTAPLSRFGYGWFRSRGKRYIAHRWSLEHFKGPIPDGLWALHTCDNRWCVNPDHLYAGTAKDNSVDQIQRGRHAWQTPGTTALYPLARRRQKEARAALLSTPKQKEAEG